MTLCSEVVIDMYRSSFVPMYRSGTPRCSEMVMYRSGPNPGLLPCQSRAEANLSFIT